MQIIRWTGGNFGMSAHNYDGDMLTDEVAQVHRSPGFITSNLIGKKDDGTMIKEYEASHGTVTDLWHAHLRGEETSLNPLGLVEAMIGAMQHAAKLEVDAGGPPEEYEKVMTWTTTLRKVRLCRKTNRLTDAVSFNSHRPSPSSLLIAGDAQHLPVRARDEGPEWPRRFHDGGLHQEGSVEARKVPYSGRGGGERECIHASIHTNLVPLPFLTHPLSSRLTLLQSAPVLGEPDRAFRRNHQVDEDAVKAMFEQYDTDGNGAIDYEEFTNLLVKLGVAPQKVKKEKEADV